MRISDWSSDVCSSDLVAEVLVHRQENEAGTWVDAGHDGYARRFGIEHRRRFYLSSNGQDLRGEDTLLPVAGRGLKRRASGELRFDIRFHLAPGVEPVPTADGQAALIKLPDGRVWQLDRKRTRLKSRH